MVHEKYFIRTSKILYRLSSSQFSFSVRGKMFKYVVVTLVSFLVSRCSVVYGQSFESPGISLVHTADTLNCPLGYSWNGYACYSVITETLICPGGYYWNGQLCLPANQNALLKCSYTDQNRTLENSPDIVPSRMLNVTVALTQDPFMPEILCPSDYSWNGYQCTQTFTIKTKCPSDYDLVDGQCQHIVHGSCPTSEYRLINSECIYESRIDVSCPAGYWKDVNNCVHSMPSCLDGYSLVDGICVKSILGKCPPATEMYNGQCISRDVSNVNCPQGYGWNGRDCVHSTASCPEGYNMINDKCERVSFTEAAFACPPMSTLSENRTCISQEKFCADGYILINGTCIENATLCHDGYSYEDGQCWKIKCEPDEPATTTVQPISPVPYCPDGYILQGNECIKYDTSTATPTELPTYPPIPPICPDGYTFYEYRCLKSGAQQPPITVPHTVRPTCPLGYILEGSDCVSLFVIPQQPELPSEVPPICPTGYELRDNKCYVSTAFNPNTPVTVVCPVGFRYVNGTCISESTITEKPYVDMPVIPLDPCPFGYAWSNGSCIKAVPICPDGFVFFKDACYLKPTPHPDLDEIPTTTQTTYWEVHTSHIPPQSPDCPPCGQSICCNQTTAGTKDIHISNVINNNNTIYHPVNISTVNENHIVLHLGSDGGISVGQPNDARGRNDWQIKYIRNNETFGSPPQDLDFDGIDILNESSNSSISDGGAGSDNGILNQTEDEKCCEVHSPRQCKQQGEEWVCYHRKYNRCGNFCTHPKIYLKPKATNLRGNVLVIKPPPPRFARLMPYREERKKATGTSGEKVCVFSVK